MRHGATVILRAVGEPTCIRWVEDARGRQKGVGRNRRRQRDEGLNRRGRREGDIARQEDVGNHTD